MEIIDKYKNIPDDEFVPLDCLGDNFKGLYEINKSGQFRKVSNGLVLSTNSLNPGGYPIICLVDLERKKHVFQVHRLLAEMFLSNPENLPSVDHISRDRENFSLSGLRWASWSDQVRNRGNLQSKNFVYSKIDEFGNEISRITTRELSKDIIKKISMAAHRNRIYDGFYWKLIDLDVEEYSKSHPLPKDESEWVPCLRLPDKLECTRSGYFRFIQYKTKRIVVGHKNNGGYLTFHFGETYFAHRLIYETFSGKLLDSNIDVSHKDTCRINNEFSNLEENTRIQNMNNYLTRQKSMKRIKQYSLKGEYIKTFDSLKSASDEIGTSVINYRKNRGNIVSGFMWCLEGEEYQIENIINNGIFKYDKNGNAVDWFLNITEASNNSTSCRKSIRNSIKTGLLCSDEYYYSKGSRVFKNK